jgi:hypothetical protein
MLDFRLPVWLHSIETTSTELLDPENIGVAVGISFLSHLQAEIQGGGVVSTPLGPQGKPEITFESSNPFSQFSHQKMRK